MKGHQWSTGCMEEDLQPACQCCHWCVGNSQSVGSKFCANAAYFSIIPAYCVLALIRVTPSCSTEWWANSPVVDRLVGPRSLGGKVDFAFLCRFSTVANFHHGEDGYWVHQHVSLKQSKETLVNKFNSIKLRWIIFVKSNFKFLTCLFIRPSAMLAAFFWKESAAGI